MISAMTQSRRKGAGVERFHIIVTSTGFLRIYPKSPRNTNTCAGKFAAIGIPLGERQEEIYP
jgi:hypothetical protein